jgi:hypothetical protein
MGQLNSLPEDNVDSKYIDKIISQYEVHDQYYILGGCTFLKHKNSVGQLKENRLCIYNEKSNIMYCFNPDKISKYSHNMKPTSDHAYIEIDGMRIYPRSHYLVDKGYNALVKYFHKKNNGETWNLAEDLCL